MTITLNGEDYQLAETISLQQLLQNLQIDPTKVAIERNLEIVSASNFAKTIINQGDAIEIVQFIGGG